MDTNEANRIETTNSERYQLSLAQGWHFRADAPDLLDRWRVLPFSQHGDKRLAFGMLAGAYQGMPFSTFDFHRRPTVTSVHTRWTNKKVNELDTITIDSVWVITLPVAMPNFQIVSSVDSAFEVDAYPEPATADRKFNRWYKLIDTDPNLAVHILTPQVMSTMRQLKLHTWSLVGNELVYVEHPIFGRTKPDDVLAVLGKLLSLVSLLPLHLGQQQAPQPPQAQPHYGQQPQHWQQPQPPQPQPGYPPQNPHAYPPPAPGYPQPGQYNQPGPYGPPRGY
ncbi:hypothetical protein AB5J62_03180 [Amycolatopsis sp. cg5]|uniref:hypothetical protein n=1 Tax=Amycolatopsis sp. cg5 TaxID=3238802 RepID=UPI003524BE56